MSLNCTNKFIVKDYTQCTLNKIDPFQQKRKNNTLQRVFTSYLSGPARRGQILHQPPQQKPAAGSSCNIKAGVKIWKTYLSFKYT